MMFEVAVGSGCYCRVLLSALCSGDCVVAGFQCFSDSEIDDASIDFFVLQ